MPNPPRSAPGNGRADSQAGKPTPDDGADGLTVRLTGKEAEVLLKACKAHKQRVPVYIEANKSEIDAVDSIISKLSQANYNRAKG